VTFCDISTCHNVTLDNFVTFLGICHMSKNRRNVTNITNLQPL